MPDSTPTQLSARSRYVILASAFLVLGTPMSVFLLINAHGRIELAYRAIAGIALFAIGARFAWIAWRTK